MPVISLKWQTRAFLEFHKDTRAFLDYSLFLIVVRFTIDDVYIISFDAKEVTIVQALSF